MKKTNYILIALILLIIGCKKETTITSSEFQTFFDKLTENIDFNGTVLIYKNGETIYKEAFGFADLDKKPLEINSTFRLASVSKQFTAMGIMILKEQGKLKFDQNVKDFIPELPYKNITIRNLLNHTSGLPDYERLLDEFWKPELAKDDPKRFISGNEDIIDLLVEKHPEIRFNPLDDYEYSNTGYVLLATTIERVSGQSFKNFLEQYIFGPAKMNNTQVYHYQPTFDPDFPNRVFGFKATINGNDLIANDAHYINFAKGDGGVFSTVEDLLKWDRYLYKNQIISETTLNEAFTEVKLNDNTISNYGFGWGLEKSLIQTKVVAHSGGWVGFRTYFYRDLEADNCFIILTNNTSNYLREINTQIKNILYEKPYAIPKKNISEVIEKVILNKGLDDALKEFQLLKSSEEYTINEYQLNNVAYTFQKLNRLDVAIELYKLSLSEYPNSAYTNKYLAQALLKNKDTINALDHYMKSYALDSTFTDSYEWIQKLK